MGTYKEYQQTVLDAMWSDSFPDDEDEEGSLWEGGGIAFIEGQFEGTGIKVNAGKILVALQQCGAITQLSRGGGATKSVYRLNRRVVSEGDTPVRDPYYHSPTQQRDQKFNALVGRLNKLERKQQEYEKFIPMLLEIACERAGAPSPAEQIAAAYEEAAEGSVRDQLQSLVVDGDQNSTQDDA